MKGILLLVLGICFVASVAADAGNEINFVFSGMIPASAGSGGDGYQQSREEGYEVTTYEYWIPEGADGTHPGDRQVFVNKFYANNGTQTAETLGECYWINADKQVCQWTLRALEGDDAIILYQRYAHASSNPKGKAAIVGGTGSYARATGECEVDSDLSYNVFNYDCQIRF